MSTQTISTAAAIPMAPAVIGAAEIGVLAPSLARHAQMKARVDVIVPCYHQGHWLPACIRSVLAQEQVDVRVLLVDDASTDTTEWSAGAWCRWIPASRTRAMRLPAATLPPATKRWPS